MVGISITYEKEKVILCYSKNPASFSSEIEVIRKIKDQEEIDNVIGVITGPGNRNEKYYNDMSSLVASICNAVFIGPPKSKYLRGRSEEELISLFSSSIPPNKILGKQSLFLSEVISRSRHKLKGKNLFVVFNAFAEADMDISQILEEAESDYHE